jgi:5'-methylthioadenosine phosphorylase
MTAATEAKLCREAEVCFASLALVTDYDAWHAEEAPVSVAAVVAVLRPTSPARRTSFAGWGPGRERRPVRPRARAAAHAVITAPDAITAEARSRLRLLHGRDP